MKPANNLNQPSNISMEMPAQDPQSFFFLNDFLTTDCSFLLRNKNKRTNVGKKK
jgi:hypothetical protein